MKLRFWKGHGGDHRDLSGEPVRADSPASARALALMGKKAGRHDPGVNPARESSPAADVDVATVSYRCALFLTLPP